MRPEVGKAYLGWDGCVRWFTHRSQRGYLHCLWRDAEGRWHNGGSYLPGRIDFGKMMSGGEVEAPKTGDKIQRMGVYGTVIDDVVR